MRTGDHIAFFFGGQRAGPPNSRLRFVAQARWWLDERHWLEITGSAGDSLEFREILTIIRSARIR